MEISQGGTPGIRDSERDDKKVLSSHRVSSSILLSKINWKIGIKTIWLSVNSKRIIAKTSRDLFWNGILYEFRFY